MPAIAAVATPRVIGIASFLASFVLVVVELEGLLVAVGVLVVLELDSGGDDCVAVFSGREDVDVGLVVELGLHSSG